MVMFDNGLTNNLQLLVLLQSSVKFTAVIIICLYTVASILGRGRTRGTMPPPQ